MSAITIGNLTVIAEDPSHNGWAYDTVKPLVETALQILKSKRGFAALQNYAKKLIRARNSQPNNVAYDVNDAEDHVTHFLDRVRRDFPEVRTSDIISDGETHPKYWGDDPWDYTPKQAGTIKLNSTILSNMVHAKNLGDSSTSRADALDREAREEGSKARKANQKLREHEDSARHYRRERKPAKERRSAEKASFHKAQARAHTTRKSAAETEAAAKRKVAKNARTNHTAFQFHMIITVAHEVVHLFTRYLHGNATPNAMASTPPHIASPFFSHQPDTGEAGGYWETLLFNGAIHFYEDTKDPLGARQAGIAYLFRGSTTCLGVKQSYMEDIVNGDLKFPARTFSDEINVADIGESMTNVRDATAATHSSVPATATASGSSNNSSSSQVSSQSWSLPIRSQASAANYQQYSAYTTRSFEEPGSSQDGYETTSYASAPSWTSSY